MTDFVLVHGAWHTGNELRSTARFIESRGHSVHLPTLAGNRPGDTKFTTLKEAIYSLVEFVRERKITDAVFVGHSYGGMIITGAADELPEGVIRRLVYWSAFVPNDGECLNDMVPAHYVDLFSRQEKEDGSVMLPFSIWREHFINDGDLETARNSYSALNPHPYSTFKEKIRLKGDPRDIPLPKSFLNCTEDNAIPQSLGWHPGLSEKLGIFRLVQVAGSHELCFTNPELLALKILEAGRD